MGILHHIHLLIKLNGQLKANIHSTIITPL